MWKFRTCLIFWLILLGVDAYAQIPQNPLGLHPSKMKWKQINTDKVQIVFPEGNEKQGLRVADICEQLWQINSINVGGKRKKISIHLYPLNTMPNGRVTPGPFRSEFFLTSPQFNCTTDWLDNLTIHEYQHVKQFANADRGITKLAHHFLGSWAWGGFAATALPRWFWEGDAVLAETALSGSGRGRMPAFLMEYRTLLHHNIRYNYEKAGAGSYRNFVPDWYNLGYHMISRAKSDYGLDIWAKVLPEAVSYKGIFFPFSRSLKKHTGLKTKELYERTMDSIQSKLNISKSQLSLRSNVDVKNPSKRTVTDYTNGLLLSEGKIMAMKSGFRDIPTVVMIDENGNESKLLIPGVRHDHPFGTLSYRKDKLVWAELNQHLRWRYTNYSDLYVYELPSRKKLKITKNGRYFSPSFNHQGNKIVAVSINSLSQAQLIIIDLNNHSRQILANQEGWMYAYPIWGSEDNSIIVVGQKEEQHSIVSIDINNGKHTVVYGPVQNMVSHPAILGDTIFFSSGKDGVQNIFALTPANQLAQVTHSITGAFHPAISPDGQTLIFSEFTPQGYELKVKAVLQGWSDIDNLSSVYPHHELITHQENEGSILTQLKPGNWEIEKYPKASGLILPHSLLPNIDPPLYGGSVLLDNKFSTLSGEVGTYYNENNKDWTYFADFVFGGWWPEVILGFRHWNRNNDIYDFRVVNDTTLHTNFYREHWSENRISVGLNLPLRFNTGSFFHRFTTGIRLNHMLIDTDGNRLNPDNNRDTLRGPEAAIRRFNKVEGIELKDQNFSTLDFSLRYQTLIRRARQHIESRWGFALSARWQYNLDEILGGNLFTTTALAFLPGIQRNHSLKLGYRYRRSNLIDPYSFPDPFLYPNGYDAFVNDEISYLSVNYKLPLAYPDWAIGSLAFIQRIKMDLFYNHARSVLKFPFDATEYARSLGVEWTFDIRLLRLLDVDVGFRYSYLLDPDLSPDGSSHQFDFLVLSIGG